MMVHSLLWVRQREKALEVDGGAAVRPAKCSGATPTASTNPTNFEARGILVT